MEKDGWRREKRDGRKPHRDKGWLIWHCRTFGSFVLQWILIDSVFGRHFGGGPNLLFLSTEWLPRIGRINREDWNISGTKEAVVQIWSKGSRGLSQIGLNVWLPRESRACWESQEHCLSTISEQIFSTWIVTNIELALSLLLLHRYNILLCIVARTLVVCNIRPTPATCRPPPLLPQWWMPGRWLRRKEENT